MSEQGPEPPENDPPPSSGRASPLPSPDDRLWRHPAEVAAEQRALTRQGGPTHRSAVASSTLAAAAVAALGSGLLVTGLLVLMSSTAATPVASAGGSFGVVLDRADAASAPAPPIELSIVGLRATDGTDIGTGLALRTGSELVTSLDLVAGTPLEATLPDGSSRRATVIGHDDLTGVSAVRLVDGVVPGAAIDTDGRVAASDDPLMATASRPSGWSHATVSVTRTDLEPGDPILDHGRVTAMVTSLTDDGAAATPIAVVERVALQLFSTGHASHPWLGVQGHDSADHDGVVVTRVVAGSPAALNDITVGMVITGIGESPVASIGELLTRLRAHRPGDDVTVEVLDGTRTRRLVVSVGDTADAPD